MNFNKMPFFKFGAHGGFIYICIVIVNAVEGSGLFIFQINKYDQFDIECINSVSITNLINEIFI